MASRDPEKGSSFQNHAPVTVPESREGSGQDGGIDMQRPKNESLTFPNSNDTTMHSSRANSPSRVSDQNEKASDPGELAMPADVASTGPLEPSPDNDKQFIVGLDGDDDPMNPKNKSLARKWLIVIMIAFGSYCVTNCSSIYTTTYTGMNEEFGSSRIVATLGLSTFVFGLGVAPLLLGPLSEFYGRKPVFIFSFLGFTIWLIPCAVAQNIQTMLIARFFDGFCGSAFLSVAGGTVGDMFTKETLQGKELLISGRIALLTVAAPMMVYSAAPFLGPASAPIMGGL